MTGFFGRLSGSIAAMPSKSMSHRAMIAGALSAGESKVNNLVLSDDVSATLRCIEALGAKIELSDGRLKVTGITGRRPVALLPCRESGTTYRMLYPVAPLIADRVEFAIAPSLARRPMAPMLSLLRSRGVEADQYGVSGTYGPGRFLISGNISSQYISGLLFSLSLLDDESRIIPTTQIESAGYIEMTRSCIKTFGGDTAWDNGELVVRPARFRPCEITVPGDYSHASLYLAAGAVYGQVTVTGLAPDPLQGDMAILDILSRMGAKVSIDGDSVTVSEGPLTGIDMDATHTPDIVPAVAVAACAARGETRIYNASRLRFKESDRISAIVQELGKLGADIWETRDGFIIHGGKRLRSNCCCAHNDHRIAMMLAIMGGLCGGVEIDVPGCAAKSAPRFFEEFTTLGGKVR